MRLSWRVCVACAALVSVAAEGFAQPAPLTWADVRDRFHATNPTVQAGRIGIDESKADEVTAFLRPNPLWSLTFDQIGDTGSGNAFSASTLTTNVSYLHERQGKRELRRDSARGATSVAESSQLDLERTLVFNLRAAFVQLLQAKAFRTLAQDNLTSYDEVLTLGPRPAAERRHRADRSRSPRAAARHLRVGRPDGGGQPPDREDSAAADAERPDDARRPVRRLGDVRLLGSVADRSTTAAAWRSTRARI